MKLLLGNEALARGALEGGASFFAGYPLPPSSEIDAALLRALPARGGDAVLAEDAPAALAAALGAGAGGGLGVTTLSASTLGAASELLHYAVQARLPVLALVVGARPHGPDPETATQEEAGRLRVSAADGSMVPVWCPASSQECFLAAHDAARTARETRGPAMVYVDHVIAHLREPVDLDLAPPALEPYELYRSRDASIVVVAFGIVARAARTAIRLARERGLRAGLFRCARLWPFPHAELAEAASRARSLLVAELNEGQVWEILAARDGIRDEASREGAGRAPRAIQSLGDARRGALSPARILEALAEAA